MKDADGDGDDVGEKEDGGKGRAHSKQRRRRSKSRKRRQRPREVSVKEEMLATPAQATDAPAKGDKGRRGPKKLRKELMEAAEAFRAAHREEVALIADQARQHDYELDRLRRARLADIERQNRFEREPMRSHLVVWGVPLSAKWRENTSWWADEITTASRPVIAESRDLFDVDVGQWPPILSFRNSTARRAAWGKYLELVKGRGKGKD